MVVVQHLLVVWLVIGLPLWDHFDTRRLKADPTETAKIRSYRFTITWLWIAAAVAVAARGFDTLYYTPIGIIPSAIQDRDFSVISWVLVVLFVAALAPVIISRFHSGLRKRLADEIDSMAFFVPHSRHTRAWFGALSITAGICEEFVYRGFLLLYFTTTLGLDFIVAVALSCMIFGVAHAYQGRTGMLMTTGLAFLFFCLYVFTGSLLVPILLHVIADLRILLGPNPSSEASAA